MAKISTYPADATPSLSDMVIGTDVNDANNTKNYSIGSILGLANLGTYVPYTGATANVDLGSNDLTTLGTLYSFIVDASSFIVGGYVDFIGGSSELRVGGNAGLSGEVFASGGSGLSPYWSPINTLISNNLWKGSFYDSVTQTLTGGANVAVPMILGTTDPLATNGVSVVSDGVNLTRITFANTGIYNIMFSSQFTNSGGTGQTVDIWLRKNGSTAAANVPDTNGKIHLQSNQNYVMAMWNYFIAINAGDYSQLMWTATSTNITMVAEAATAVHPATPSVIVTVNQV
jgi:hypothetical protein